MPQLKLGIPVKGPLPIAYSWVFALTCLDGHIWLKTYFNTVWSDVTCSCISSMWFWVFTSWWLNWYTFMVTIHLYCFMRPTYRRTLIGRVRVFLLLVVANPYVYAWCGNIMFHRCIFWCICIKHETFLWIIFMRYEKINCGYFYS